MSDESSMRLRLQQVAAYRELRRSVQRSGRENVVFSLIMMGLAAFLYSQNVAGPGSLIFYGLLIFGELCVGLFKWLVPVAEAFLLDALVMAAFAAFIGWREYVAFQNGRGLNPVYLLFAFLIVSGAVNKLKSYRQLKQLFAERPDPEHIAWFDDLVAEVRTADPTVDRTALDLPTKPHWKAKLLGGTAFFVTATGSTVWVAGADDFTLRREKAERGAGYRKGLLSIHGEGFPEFDLDDASWDNYARWVAGQQPTAS